MTFTFDETTLKYNETCAGYLSGIINDCCEGKPVILTKIGTKYKIQCQCGCRFTKACTTPLEALQDWIEMSGGVIFSNNRQVDIDDIVVKRVRKVKEKYKARETAFAKELYTLAQRLDSQD